MLLLYIIVYALSKNLYYIKSYNTYFPLFSLMNSMLKLSYKCTMYA